MKALRWANYDGDQTEWLGHVMGPNTLNEWMVVVTADYDAAADRTRLGFRFATAEQVAAHLRDTP